MIKISKLEFIEAKESTMQSIVDRAMTLGIETYKYTCKRFTTVYAVVHETRHLLSPDRTVVISLFSNNRIPCRIMEYLEKDLLDIDLYDLSHTVICVNNLELDGYAGRILKYINNITDESLGGLELSNVFGLCPIDIMMLDGKVDKKAEVKYKYLLDLTLKKSEYLSNLNSYISPTSINLLFENKYVARTSLGNQKNATTLVFNYSGIVMNTGRQKIGTFDNAEFAGMLILKDGSKKQSHINNKALVNKSHNTYNEDINNLGLDCYIQTSTDTGQLEEVIKSEQNEIVYICKINNLYIDVNNKLFLNIINDSLELITQTDVEISYKIIFLSCYFKNIALNIKVPGKNIKVELLAKNCIFESTIETNIELNGTVVEPTLWFFDDETIDTTDLMNDYDHNLLDINCILFETTKHLYSNLSINNSKFISDGINWKS